MPLWVVTEHSLEQLTLILEAKRREDARDALSFAACVRNGFGAEAGPWRKFVDMLVAEAEKGI